MEGLKCYILITVYPGPSHFLALVQKPMKAFLLLWIAGAHGGVHNMDHNPCGETDEAPNPTPVVLLFLMEIKCNVKCQLQLQAFIVIQYAVWLLVNSICCVRTHIVSFCCMCRQGHQSCPVPLPRFKKGTASPVRCSLSQVPTSGRTRSREF